MHFGGVCATCGYGNAATEVEDGAPQEPSQDADPWPLWIPATVTREANGSSDDAHHWPVLLPVVEPDTFHHGYGVEDWEDLLDVIDDSADATETADDDWDLPASAEDAQHDDQHESGQWPSFVPADPSDDDDVDWAV